MAGPLAAALPKKGPGSIIHSSARRSCIHGIHLRNNRAWPLFLLLVLPLSCQAEGAWTLASVWETLGLSKSQPSFLDPDKAFVFTADVIDEGTIVTRWQIAKDYYLYRDKFAFSIVDGSDVSLGEPIFPSGGTIKQDEYFGVMVVYYDHVDVTVPLARKDPSIRRVKMQASYQGCAEAGFCYPPLTKTVELELPPADAVTPAASK